ncbi:chitinase [Paenibacillus chitinolyticus]|uniref:chitinase n=1 Tax=Paenibacillus chitinolyticus TaxID=79263 RepID=UPI00363AF1FE
MSHWKYPLSTKFMYRALCLALGSAILLSPLQALAASGTSYAVEAGTSYSSHKGENDNAYRKGGKHKRLTQGSQLEVGESRVLNSKEIRKEWGGIESEYGPDKAVEAVKAALPRKDYEELFPYRLGSAQWHEAAKGKEYYKENQTDYFSYDNLIQAVTEAANIKYKVGTRKGSKNSQEVFRLDKEGKTETLVSRSADFNSEANRGKIIETEIVDYGTFLKEGTKKNRKRELAALLAHLSHETGGGWDAAPGGPLRWGLFWNENIAGRTGQNMSNFVDPDSSKLYPGFGENRYYGRGPIMLSWNFNYGLFSSIIYGDKNILLKNPEIVAAEGKIGFMTAILFWMTPQAPKPSAHDVMIGRWKASKELAEKGLKPAGFGITTMVLNGLEANQPETRRAAHYRDITSRMGIDISGEKLDTLGMKPF